MATLFFPNKTLCGRILRPTRVTFSIHLPAWAFGVFHKGVVHQFRRIINTICGHGYITRIERDDKMGRITFALIVIVTGSFFTCRNNGTEPATSDFQFTAEDVGVTEVWLRMKATEPLDPRRLTLSRWPDTSDS